MSPLTTSAIPQELQREALLTLEQLITSIAVLPRLLVDDI